MWQWEATAVLPYSTDGISWNKTTAGSGLLYSVCYGNENMWQWEMATALLTPLTESNNWVTKAVTGIGMDGICYGNGKFVAVGSIGRVLTPLTELVGILLKSEVVSHGKRK